MCIALVYGTHTSTIGVIDEGRQERSAVRMPYSLAKSRAIERDYQPCGIRGGNKGGLRALTVFGNLRLNLLLRGLRGAT